MRLAALFFLVILMYYCQQKEKKPMVIEEVSLGTVDTNLGPLKLSEWNFFESPLKGLKPKKGVSPYTLNTPLFSDYAVKTRFFRLPENTTMTYHDSEVFDFPEGSVMIKNFFYPADFSKTEQNIRMMETRLLIRENDEWKALTYVWDDDQVDATLEIAGASIPVSWKDNLGKEISIDYSVPNLIQCKSCHERNGKMTLIGPTARQLNRTSGQLADKVNQIEKWVDMELLSNIPDLDQIPRLPQWDNEYTGTLSERARAWLEINCAHCHRQEGPAKNTGLYLLASEQDMYRLGIHKPPVAAGRGSGGLKYSIVPGEPEASILYHRINSLDPGVMMPELGRKLNHEEGLALVYDWISSM